MAQPTPRPLTSDAAIDWSQLAVLPGRLSDALSSNLERVLLGGDVAAGTRLPSERELAAQLGVSRASVREAIHELMLKGLVVRRRGRGTLVADADGRGRGASLLGVMAPASRDVRAILDFREAIEPPITGRAAIRATPADIRSLAKLMSDMERERSRSGYAELDRRFHHFVARATHNPLLVRLDSVSAEWMVSIREDALESPKRRRTSLSGHRSILAAIAQHDEHAATAASAAHVRRIGSIVVDAGVRRSPARIKSSTEASPRPASSRPLGDEEGGGRAAPAPSPR